jgi:hypothetical protein
MPGSLTTRSRPQARDSACDRIAFRLTDGVGAPIVPFAARWLAYTIPCRRFAPALADNDARLGADVVRYSFIAVDLHHLLLAGLPAHLSPKFLKFLEILVKSPSETAIDDAGVRSAAALDSPMKSAHSKSVTNQWGDGVIITTPPGWY